MYRSLEDQLRATAAAAAQAGGNGGGGGEEGDDEEDGGGVPDYQDLRELAAAHIRAHRDEFAPYIVPEDGGGDGDGGDGDGGYYAKYCDDIEMTATWGGHVELTALAAALKRRVVVHSVGMAPVVLGEQHAGPPLTVCYLRHALGVGEHYNSTEPLSSLGAGGGGDDDAEEEEEEDE
jgi:OTU domain-containing protein 6